jgi:hypothetical protein
MSIQNEIPTLPLNLPSNIQMNKKTFQKMVFITNALEQGWSVKKSNDSYIFTKKHENRREIFQENYLENFVLSNFDASILNT